MSELDSDIGKMEQEEGGLIEAETVREGGQVFMRHYHQNGKLALEMPLQGKLVNGTVRQWNHEGKLLGAYQLNMGTGQAIEWYPDGRVKGKVSMVDGLPNGLVQMWDEEGKPLGKRFMLDGRIVSRRRYEEACALNPKLPRY